MFCNRNVGCDVGEQLQSKAKDPEQLVVDSNVCTSLEKLCIEKRNKNKIRRKPRHRESKSISCMEIVKNFQIVAGASFVCARVFNVRNVNNNRISLPTYVNVQSRATPQTEAPTFKPKKRRRKRSREVVPENKERGDRKSKKREEKFADYWTKEQIEEGLADGTLIKGVIRINPKNSREAYVDNEDRCKQDYYIPTLIDRNRALEGDVVVLSIRSEQVQAGVDRIVGKVVYILEQVHSRIFVGSLVTGRGLGRRFATLTPRDCRVPQVEVPVASSSPTVYNFLEERAEAKYDKVLFKIKILEWNRPRLASGIIVETIGTGGELESETRALLVEHGFDVTSFSDRALSYVPDIPLVEEIAKRRDLRNDCIFTIDPATARDLDDALSCKLLENGHLEIGVHISDVSLYLEEGTPLDAEVGNKATSIYLVNGVYHMLPEELCMRCSLLPGQDKFAFSVFWEMTKDGEMLSVRFDKTVINSCTQLSYEHALAMIDDCDGKFENLPTIYNNFLPQDLEFAIINLNDVAVKLRSRRVESGSLSLHQAKLCFRLDSDSGAPLDYTPYRNTAAHRMIEEFMLLANISVAERIKQDFPDVAFLRCHDPPKSYMMDELANKLKKYGIDLDVSSSKALQSSLSSCYIEEQQDGSVAGVARVAALNHLLTKPMTRARYFCTGNRSSADQYRHYGLSVPLYTHFTSPIRRYADVMVHRLLSASLKGVDRRLNPAWTTDYVSNIAANCNKQKYNAKKAGELSNDLFLAHLVQTKRCFVRKAVVVDVKDGSFDALVIDTGSIVRIYFKEMENEMQVLFEKGDDDDDDKKKVVVTFPENHLFAETVHVIELFAIVTVSLVRRDVTHKLDAKLLRPIASQVISRSSQ